MYLPKNNLPEKVEIRYYKDIEFTYCNNHFDFGVLIHTKGRTYIVPSFDTSDCETFFIFRGKKNWTHTFNKKVRVDTPDWIKKWVIKNDFRA
jgi:hypothetical protein